jgi:oligopeptide transport system substrate-binding protein
MFRGSWSGDYNSPQDWYDLFIGQGNPTGSGYDYQPFFALLNSADASSGPAAEVAYRQAGQMLLDQAIVAPLFYYVRTAVVKPYVDGFGANALYVYSWRDISIRQH